MGLGNAYMKPLGYVVIQVQVDGVQGYDEDQNSPSNPGLIQFCGSDSYHFWDPHHQLSHQHDKGG